MLTVASNARLECRLNGGKRRPTDHITTPNAAAAILVDHAAPLTPSWRIATMPIMSAGSGAQAGSPLLSMSGRESIYSESICRRLVRTAPPNFTLKLPRPGFGPPAEPAASSPA